jgi:hypothetical protein
MPKMTGSCRCGAVTYEADTEPMFVGVCHCKNCQKETGSAFVTVVGMAKSALKVTGTLKDYVGKGDSGQPTHSKFCPNCGSSMIHEPDVMPELTMIGVGTLDDSSWIKPAMEIYCDSKQSWVSLGLPQSFPKMPGPPG